MSLSTTVEPTRSHAGHGRVTTLTTATFRDAVKGPGIVVIDFSTPWCGPCRVFAPVFAAASQRHADLRWAAVDSDDEPALAIALDVRAAPTLVIFRDGVLVHRQAGALTATALDKVIDRVRALDVEAYRAAAQPALP